MQVAGTRDRHGRRHPPRPTTARADVTLRSPSTRATRRCAAAPRRSSASRRCRASPTATSTCSCPAATRRRSPTAARIPATPDDVGGRPRPAAQRARQAHARRPAGRHPGLRHPVRRQVRRGGRAAGCTSTRRSPRPAGCSRSSTVDTPALSDFIVASSQARRPTWPSKREDLTGLVDRARRLHRRDRPPPQGRSPTRSASCPPFMRRANSTFVNLRAAVDDLRPLVEESKPVTPKLRRLLAELRPLARDARPTVRDLSRARPPARRRQRPRRAHARPGAAARHRHDATSSATARSAAARSPRPSTRCADVGARAGVRAAVRGRPHRLVRRLRPLGPLRRARRQEPRRHLRQRVRPGRRRPQADPGAAAQPGRRAGHAPRASATAARAPPSIPADDKSNPWKPTPDHNCDPSQVLPGGDEADRGHPRRSRRRGAASSCWPAARPTASRRASEFKVELDNAFGLIEGGDLKVAGVRAGKITDARPRPQHASARSSASRSPRRASATCARTPPARSSRSRWSASTTSTASPASDREKLAGRRHDPGRAARRARSRPTSSTTSCAAPYRERLSFIVAELGAAVARQRRQPQRGAAPRDARRCARRTRSSRCSPTRTRCSPTWRATPTASSATWPTTAATSRAGSTETRDTARASAERDADIAGGLPAAARVPARAAPDDGRARPRPPTRRARRCATCRASADQLERLLRQRPAVRDGVAPGDRRARRGVEDRPRGGRSRRARRSPSSTKYAAGVPELGKNLAIILEHLDDRNYSVERDPRSPGGQGYTGLEALLQYVFDQTLSTNIHDGNTHILKAFAVRGRVRRLRRHRGGQGERRSDCSTALGPNAVGINFPDVDRAPRLRRQGPRRPGGRGRATAGADPAAAPPRRPRTAPTSRDGAASSARGEQRGAGGDGAEARPTPTAPKLPDVDAARAAVAAEPGAAAGARRRRTCPRRARAPRSARATARPGRAAGASSTSCSAHEAAARRIDRRQPRPRRGGHACSSSSSRCSSRTTRTTACRSSRRRRCYAELPNGADVNKGVEVREGGYRIGVVEDLEPRHAAATARSARVLQLKLDESAGPVPDGLARRSSGRARRSR